MDITVYVIILVGTGLVLAAAFTSLIAFRFGAPLLLVFLLIGLLAGVDGLGIDFDNAQVAYFVGSVALAIILFDSGFGTALRSLRLAAAPAVVLSTVGVLLTAGLLGTAAHYILNVSWLEGLLLGAIVGSTDAAAVFFLLRAGDVAIRDKVRSTLEIESGSNDPMAIFLTLTLVSALTAGTSMDGEALISQIILGFLQQMGIGAVLGLAGGWAIVRLTQRLNLDRGLQPIFVIALSLMVFGLAGLTGGSGFLAVYIAGLVAGNRLKAPAAIKRFQDGVTWLAQIIMFLVLGLFATPSQFPLLALPALALAVILMFLARPLAVTLCLLPFRVPRAETAFTSWVGLRGATSILLALTPLISGLESGRMLFNIAFMIVMMSLLVQGWTILPLARRLSLIVPPRIGPLAKYEVDLPGSAHHELLAYKIAEESPVARGTRIPRWARPSLVVRGNRSMTYQYAGRPQPGDHVYIFVPSTYPRLLDRLFASRAELSADDADFFGAFPLDPTRPAREMAETYEVDLADSEQDLSIADLMRSRLGGRAEYADRVSLGTIELIVREADEDGTISAVGLSVEPTVGKPRVPVYLSFGEMFDRVRLIFVRPEPPADLPKTDEKDIEKPKQ